MGEVIVRRWATPMGLVLSLGCFSEPDAVSGACSPGELGCACDAGACQGSLECFDDEVCAPVGCERGVEGCPCDNGSCLGSLVCNAGLCEPAAGTGDATAPTSSSSVTTAGTVDDSTSQPPASTGSTTDAPPLRSHRVFLSPETVTPRLADTLADYAAHCEEFAPAPSEGMVWAALLGTSTQDPINAFQLEGDVIRAGDQVLVAAAGDLWSGGLQAPIDRDAEGNLLSESARVWTGFTADGLTSKNTCEDWVTNANGVQGGVGHPFMENGQWALTGNNDCGNARHLYCIEVLVTD